METRDCDMTIALLQSNQTVLGGEKAGHFHDIGKSLRWRHEKVDADNGLSFF